MAKNRKRPVGTDDTGTDYGMLPGLVGFHLRFAHQAVFEAFARDLTDEFSLTPTQFGSLVLVDRNPGITQSALSKAIGIKRPSAMAIVDQLEKRDLLERRPLDRRSNGLHLTEAGMAFLKTVEPRVRTHDDAIAERLEPGEIERLVDLLDRLAVP